MTPSSTRLPALADIVGLYHRAPKALLLSSERIAVALVASTTVVWIAVALLRRRRTAKALHDRASFDLLPTNSFDPSPEEIHRFSRILQRARLAAPGWTPRHAAAVRIRLHTIDSGRLAYRIEGSARAASALSQQSYAGVELHAVRQAEPADTAHTP
jgi:hypothetical protein